MRTTHRLSLLGCLAATCCLAMSAQAEDDMPGVLTIEEIGAPELAPLTGMDSESNPAGDAETVPASEEEATNLLLEKARQMPALEAVLTIAEPLEEPMLPELDGAPATGEAADMPDPGTEPAGQVAEVPFEEELFEVEANQPMASAEAAPEPAETPGTEEIVEASPAPAAETADEGAAEATRRRSPLARFLTARKERAQAQAEATRAAEPAEAGTAMDVAEGVAVMVEEAAPPMEVFTPAPMARPSAHMDVAMLVEQMAGAHQYSEQKRARDRLVAMGSTGGEAVLGLLGPDQGTLVRTMAIGVVRDTRPGSAYPLLLSLLNDPDQRIRFHADTALKVMTGHDVGYYHGGNTGTLQEGAARWDEFLARRGMLHEAPVVVESTAPRGPRLPFLRRRDSASGTESTGPGLFQRLFKRGKTEQVALAD